MIIQNINSSSDVPPAGYVSNGVPRVVANASSVEPAIQQPSSQQLQSAVDGINQAMQSSNSSLEFSVNPGTKEPVVTMVDTATGQIISQYPSKEAIAISQEISQFQQRQGLLFNQKA
jgi:flagellar protein FlaG